MIIGDYQRFQSIYHLVVVSKFETLQASLRAVEMPMDELVTILHRIEWDGETRIFRIAEGKLVFTNDGRARVGLWAQAVNALGIAV